MLAYYNPIKPNLLRAIPPSQKTILQIQATNWRRAQATMQRLKKKQAFYEVHIYKKMT